MLLKLLFEIIKKDLEQTRRNPSPTFSINIVFHICRGGDLTQTVDRMAATNKFLVEDPTMDHWTGKRFFKYPNEAQIVPVRQVPPGHLMEMIGFNVQTQFVGMRPLGSRNVQHGLHFVLQGCFYNLMVYLGITSYVGGEVMTSIQNEGITSRMYLNFVDLMNKTNSFRGLRPFAPTSQFVVERLPIVLIIQPAIQPAPVDPNNGISKLLHAMLAISQKFITTMSPGVIPPAHAILVKLMHRRRDEDLVNTEELGHWVAFTIDPTDIIQAHAQNAQFVPWRFVDPQGLSIQTEQQPNGSLLSYTVPMSFKPLRTLDEMRILLNEFSPKFSHIDLFYVALPASEVPQGLSFSPDAMMNSVIPRLGGKHRKTKKHLKKCKSKSTKRKGSKGSKGSKRVKHNKRSKRINP